MTAPTLTDARDLGRTALGRPDDWHLRRLRPRVGLVASAEDAARALGATDIETELFDIRGGFGPDLSETVEALLGRD